MVAGSADQRRQIANGQVKPADAHGNQLREYLQRYGFCFERQPS
ncbi:hypothetical protein LMG28614_04769 [Paraburkholderia ultramafica]|uniref:Uncharacterized protein n=1 Tax=Paraburkholderia ultramafica TaxID=1544867 RepID=A0A6S7BG46_9BURK|nr:hypothetical protein LMG28614_04769 [Paraburkholderia ultramafica]